MHLSYRLVENMRASQNVKPEHLIRHLVSFCSIGHEYHLLHDNEYTPNPPPPAFKRK